MSDSKLWAEVWTRPGDANYGRVIDDPVFISGSLQAGLNKVGAGTGVLPDTFPSFDSIIKSTPDDASAYESSTIKVFSEVDPTEPIGEWFPHQLIPPQAKNDHDVQISGPGLNALLAHARVEAWDWDGSDDFTPSFPDWIYGGRNLLTNSDMEETSFTPHIYRLIIDATAGTFDVENGGDTSTNDYDVGDGTFEGNLESDLSAVDDLSVTPLSGPPIGYQLIITAQSGTFVIESPADSTAALAVGIGAAALTTALEGLSDVTDVTVTAITVDGDDGFQIDLVTPASISLSVDNSNADDGTVTLSVSNTGEGFDIELVDPAVDVSLTVDDSGLTGTASIFTIQEGAALPAGFTRSRQISTGTPRDYGTYDNFEVSTAQAHSGTQSVYINPASINSNLDRYAGIQQIRGVKLGGVYQASVWVYPTAAGQTYRLVVRALDGDLQTTSDGNDAWVTFSPPANTWTQVTLTNVMPDEDQVIVRFANVDQSGNPAGFYVDDLTFNEGLASATVGQILQDLYDDATTDHAGRIVWEDEANPGNPYLTLDFTATQDSNGDPWDQTEDVRLPMRFSYSQVMAQLAGRGYEYRIVPDNVETGQYLWQVYNPGGMDAAPDAAIQGGAADVRRRLVRRTIKGSDFLVEGEDRLTARARNTSLIDAVGRLEVSRLDREATTTDAASDEAAQDLAEAFTDSSPYNYVLINPQEEPFSAYTIGDTVTIEDPPEIDAEERRLVDVNVAWDANGVEWDTNWGGLAIVQPDAAIASAVAGLLTKFDYADEFGGDGGFLTPGGAGGMAHILISSTSEPDFVQNKADFRVSADESAGQLQDVFDWVIEQDGTGQWTIWMVGNFYLEADIFLPHGSYIRGLGETRPVVACS